MWEWYHLITNNEWMTIARNIEATQSNWSWNAVGNWFIYNGRSDDTTMWCVWSGWISDILGWTRAEQTWTECSEKRNDWKSRNILILSNWEEIWDLSGNVWEHVNKANTIDWTNHNFWFTKITWSSSWTSFDDNGIYDINDMKKYWSSLGLWITSGMWNLNYAKWVNNNIFIYGAHAYNGSNAWIFALHLNRTYGMKNCRVGFRCAK
jgi:hypothetical protein